MHKRLLQGRSTNASVCTNSKLEMRPPWTYLAYEFHFCSEFKFGGFLDFCKVSEVAKLRDLVLDSSIRSPEFWLCSCAFSIGRQFHNPPKCMCGTEVGGGSGVQVQRNSWACKIYRRSEQATTSAQHYLPTSEARLEPWPQPPPSSNKPTTAPMQDSRELSTLQECGSIWGWNAKAEGKKEDTL